MARKPGGGTCMRRPLRALTAFGNLQRRSLAAGDRCVCVRACVRACVCVRACLEVGRGGAGVGLCASVRVPALIHPHTHTNTHPSMCISSTQALTPPSLATDVELVRQYGVGWASYTRIPHGDRAPDQTRHSSTSPASPPSAHHAPEDGVRLQLSPLSHVSKYLSSQDHRTTSADAPFLHTPAPRAPAKLSPPPKSYHQAPRRISQLSPLPSSQRQSQRRSRGSPSAVYIYPLGSRCAFI